MKEVFINKYVIFSILFYLFSLVFSALNLNGICIIMSIIASFLCILSIKNIFGNYSNISFLFSAFSILYGLCGPIATIFGTGLNEIFGNQFLYLSYFISFSLSEIGLLIGISIKKNKIDCINIYKKRDKIKYNFLTNQNFLLIIIFITMLISTLFQLINTMRVGGISTIMLGKAYYQAKEAALTVTLPAEIINLLSFSCISLYLSLKIKNNQKINYLFLIVVGIVFLPYLLIIVFLGQRGKLLHIIITIFIGVFYFIPLKKVGIKIIILIIVAYLGMGILTANRSIIYLLNDDPDYFWDLATDKERYIKSLNLGTGEFGCSYGNYNFFILKNDFQYKLGDSYIKGFLMLVPSFIYPGEKPIQITYEFRDTYFPSEGNRSSIASTGFSSILEAYWNFGYIGVFLIYIIYGCILATIDLKISNNGFISSIMYTYISSFVVEFHRSAFGDSACSIILKLIVLFCLIIIPYNRLKGGINNAKN